MRFFLLIFLRLFFLFLKEIFKALAMDYVILVSVLMMINVVSYVSAFTNVRYVLCSMKDRQSSN